MKNNIYFRLNEINWRLLGKKLCAGITQNWGLKVLSLVLALIIWVYIINTTPSLTRTFMINGLSVNASGESVMNLFGLSLSTNIYEEYANAVSVQIEVAQASLAEFTNRNVVVSADLSSIRSAGDYEVPLTASSTYGTVSYIRPEAIKVTVENYDSREVPNEIVLLNESPDYWYNVVRNTINPQQISVAGPASLVQKVTTAVATIDVSQQTSTFRRAYVLSLNDSADQDVSSRLLTKSSSTCSVSVEVYPKRDLEVRIDPAEIQVAEGYEIQSIECMPESVTVAAPQGVLERLSCVRVVIPDDLAPATQSYTACVSIAGLASFKNISTDQVYMTVSVAEKSETRTFAEIPVKYVGLAEGVRVCPSSASMTLQVTGPRTLVTVLTADQIDAYVDLTGLAEGEYKLPVVLQNPDPLEYDLSPDATVSVTLTVDAGT